ncbi:hypothetical protein DIPPA_04465 [Diplonema papillatum]|nr:hypothetical protein DIPPA_04465 [Diplonema papillatum]
MSTAACRPVLVVAFLTLCVCMLLVAHASPTQEMHTAAYATALKKSRLLRRLDLLGDESFNTALGGPASSDQATGLLTTPTAPPASPPQSGRTRKLAKFRIPALPDLPTEPRLLASGITVRSVDPEPEKDEVARAYSLPGGVPFTGEMLPPFQLEQDIGPGLLRLPATPDLPTGEAALQLARSWGLPDHWNARHHPTHFILGSPKAGTTFIEKCYSSGAFAGDREHMPYPRPNVRWPVRKDRHGEPISWHTAFANANAWNRTGFRRWDLGKEPRVYLSCENYTRPIYYRSFESFPPIEEGSKNWEILDATPTYLSNPRATENIYIDHLHDPKRPRFVVAWREPFARMYSHYVMIAGKRQSLNPAAFVMRIRKEYKMLLEVPGCRVVVDDPESLMRAENKDLLRFVLNDCFVFPKYLSYSLPVLGLRYWLHHFDVSQFTVIKTTAMSKADPKFMISTLEHAFDIKALPQCKPGQDWKTENCAGPGFWSQIEAMCSDPKARGQNRAASYSSRGKTELITRGTEKDQAPFVALFEKYEALMQQLIKDFNLRLVDE